MKKFILSILLLILVIATISACNNKNQNGDIQETTNLEQQAGTQHADKQQPEDNAEKNNQNVQTASDKDVETTKAEIATNKTTDVLESNIGATKEKKKETKKGNVSKAVLLTYSIDKPLSADISDPLSVLKVVFSSDSANKAFKKGVGGSIEKYIQINPKINGKWTVKDDKSLSFTPHQEWSADTKYTVTMDKAAFNDYYKISSSQFSFKTDPFNFQIDSEQINNDYDNRERDYTLHIVFNYLFDQKQFKKEAKLTLAGKEIPFKVTFDKNGYGAVIKSSTFKMVADEDIVLNFTLPKISVADGERKLAYEINHLYVLNKIVGGQFFFVTDVEPFILNDDKGNPRNVLTVTFTQPVNISDVVQNSGLFYKENSADKFLNSDEIIESDIKLIPIYTGNNADVVHSFYVDIYDDKKYDESKSFFFAIKSKLTAVSGDSVKNIFQERVAFQRLPQTVNIMQQGSLLSLKSRKNLTFEARGVNALNVEVGKIFPEQVQHIINFTTSKGLGNITFRNKDMMDATNFAEYKKAKLPLSSNDRIMPSYATIDIEEYLGSNPGLYYVKADGLDEKGNKIYNYRSYYDDDYYYDDYYSRSNYVEASRFILVTDMYMIAKENKNNQVDVFVASISKGEPVKNAKVEVIAKNGLTIISGQTDVNGHFRYGLTKDDEPIAIIAKKDDDFTYIPFSYERNIEYSKFDIGGEYFSSVESLKAMIFTDRGIYRPGETVHIASIIKDAGWKKDLSGIPVEVVIKSPKNEIVLDEKYSLDKSGFFDLDLATQSHFTTGYYYAVVYLLDSKGDKDTSLGSVSFELKEFDTDTIRVAVSFNEKEVKGWVKNNEIKAKIKADNMYGTPAGKRRVKSEVSFASSTFYFPQFKGYRFTDPYVERNGNVCSPYKPNLPEKQTDDNGLAEYDLSNLFKEFEKGTYLLEFNSEVFEKGSGDGVTGYNSIKVSPADYLVGYYTDSYLYYLDLNEKANVNFIAVDKNLDKIALKNLKYRLLQVTYLNQFIKDKSGRYRYNTVKRYNVINSGSLSISDKGTDILLPTSVNGELVYEIVDKDNTVIGKVNYFVSGSAGIDTSLAKEAELSLKLNKSEYMAGDTIKMNITAPYSGYGLITVEKEKVYSYKWFKAETNTVVESIKVPDDLKGNGYINVVFVRDFASNDIYSKPLSYAVMPFSVDKSKNTINITLKTPEVVLPGSSVEVAYSADKSGKIIVYGVDEGILQVAGYKMPKPIDFFMQKAALLVSTKQTADLILPDYKILSERSGIGGGEDAVMAKMIANKLNPFARVVEKPVAHWSHIINVKAGEKKKETILIPDHFNGSMKVMAVAVSEDAVGSTETAFISRAPIVMTPNMPYAAVAGDKFKLSIGVTNLIENKDKSAITITAKPSKHFSLIGETSKTVTVNKGEEALVLFDVEVLDELGSGEIALEATTSDIKDIIKAKITSSIRPAVPYRTDIQAGSFKGAASSIKVRQRDMHDIAAKREVAVSTNPLIAVSGIGNYLQHYPYGCTEQITSKIYPVVLFAATNGTINTKEVQDAFNAYIRELTKRQKNTIGFVYWSGGSNIEDIPSLYATQLLIDAKELGFNVPDTLYNNAIEYAKSISNNRPVSNRDADIIAYATYLSARTGTVNSRALSVLEEYCSKSYPDWEDSLIAAYIGATYVLYKNETKGYELLRSAKPSYVRYIFFDDYYDSLLDISRYIYLAGRHAKNLIEKESSLIGMILDNINDGYYNSFSGAFALAALYGLSSESEQTPKFDDEGNGIRVDSKNKNKAVFDGDIKNINVTFDKPNKLGYYYYVTTSGFDRNIPKQVSNGLKITKSFHDKNGNVITEGKQGDEVTVVLRVKQKGDMTGRYAVSAITDLVPGGTEILTQQGVNVKSYYASHEFREDRAIIYLNIPRQYDGAISYKIKLLSSGSFTVPPTYAESLYNRDINAVGNSFNFIINEAE